MEFLIYIKQLFTTQVEIGSVILPFTLLGFTLKFLLPIGVVLITYKFVMRGIREAINRSKLVEDKKKNLFKWLRLIIRIIFFILNILILINLLGARITDYLVSFGGLLTHPIVEDISITTILLVLPILYIARIGGKASEKFARKSIIPYLKVSSSANNMIGGIIKNIASVIVIIFGLTIIGFDLTLLYGLFGIIGIGVGFGLQGMVGNLFAGFVILSTKPVKVGDHIIVDGTEGDLVEIRFINSIVSTISHESIIIPNSKLIENPVHNYSFDDRSIIIKNSVQVSYNTDLDHVLELLKNIGKDCPYVMNSKEINARVVSFDDSGISLSVISWIENSSMKYSAMSWINLEIWREFKKKGVEIPYPKLDLKIIK